MTDRTDRVETDRQDIERLSVAWNAFVRGDTGAVAGNDPDAAVVRAIHALGIAPGPDPVFLGRLKEVLMRAVPGEAASLQLRPASLPAYLSNGTAADHSLPRAGRAHFQSWRLAVAAVLAIAVGIAGMAFWTGGDNSSQPTMLPAYGAASAPALPWQETPECDVPARTVESFEALIAKAQTVLPYGPINLNGSTTGRSPASGLRSFAPSNEAGIPADAITVAAVNATVRELAECRNAHQVGRHYALWTDDAMLRAEPILTDPNDRSNRGWMTRLIGSVGYLEALEGTPPGVQADDVWTVVDVEDVRVLSDGRVRATVFYGTADGDLPLETYFVEQDGVYLLDDAEGWTYSVGG